MMRLRLQLLSCVLLGSACASRSTPDARDVASDSAAVRAASDAYISAVLANDVPALSAVWTEDAVFVNVGMPTIRGKASIDSLIQSMHSTARVTELAIQTDELSVSGDAAFLLGTYSETLTPTSGPPQRLTGRYLHVWRRQDDGSWKLARAIGA